MKRMMNRDAITKVQATILVTVVVIAAIVGVAYYLILPKPPEKPKEVKIAFLTPFTGPSAFLGDLARKGVDQAINEINSGGGIRSLGGLNITVIYYDSGGTATEATSALQRVLSLYKGELSATLLYMASGHVIACTEITEREKMTTIAGGWADIITEKGYKNLFRVCPRSSAINNWGIPALIEMAKSAGVPLKKVAFLYDDNPSTIALIDALRKLSVEYGLELVLDEMWTAPLPDATPLVTKLADAKPQLFLCYSMSLQDMVLILGKVKEMGLKITTVFYGATAMNPQFREVVGPFCEGLLLLSDWNIINNEVNFKFKEAYMKRYGVTWIPKDSIGTYAMIWIFKEAIEKAASTDPEKIKEALATIDITSGPATLIYGRVRFDSKGDTVDAAPLLAQWQNVKGVLQPVTIFPSKWATGTVIWPKY